MGGQLPEFALGLRQREGLQNARLSRRSFADKSKSAEVGDQHHAVPLPVPLHLLGPGYLADIFKWWFGFDNTARGVLNKERIVFGPASRVLPRNCSAEKRPPSGSPAPRLARLMTQRTLGERPFPISEAVVPMRDRTRVSATLAPVPRISRCRSGIAQPSFRSSPVPDR